MPDAVKPDRRAARRLETEGRLVAAASELFVTRGYAATTLAEVAERAGVAPRTVYVRFATKAALLRRCIGDAIAGDDAPGPVAERADLAAAMATPSLEGRLRGMAAVTAGLMARAGDLLDVARQGAAVDPELAAAAQAGRDDTRRTLLGFWGRLADDGLLPAGAAVGWLAETATLLAHAETYLLLRASTGWSTEEYEAWLLESWRRLAHASGADLEDEGARGPDPS